MFYPRDIAEYVLSQADLAVPFAMLIESRNRSRGAIDGNRSLMFEEWLFTEGHQRSPAIKRYVSYLASLRAQLEVTLRYFPPINPTRVGFKDEHQALTSPEQMFYIGNLLYVLDSHGVKGDVLECGAYKGFSSCCLSWVCSRLGRKLIVADSFVGLPAPKFAFEQGYYEQGDFSGSLDEVQVNLQALGRPESVEFIQGYYETSLRDFSRPLALLWMDVDLYQSATDVLNHTLDLLTPGGVIFSDEIPLADVDTSGLFRQESGVVTRALREQFEQRKRCYRAQHLLGYLGLIIPEATHRPEFVLMQSHFLWQAAGRAPDAKWVDEKQVHQARQRVIALTEQVMSTHDELTRAKERLLKVSADKDLKQAALSAAWNSPSFRIGRLMTTPWRGLRRWLGPKSAPRNVEIASSPSCSLEHSQPDAEQPISRFIEKCLKGNTENLRSRHGGLWVDLPEASEIADALLARGEIAQREFRALETFVRDGYCIIEGAIEPELIDAFNREMQQLWNSGHPCLLVGVPPHDTQEILEPRHARMTGVRMLDIYFHNDLARRILLHDSIVRFYSLIFNRSPLLFQSLSFTIGSEQGLHQDTAYVVTLSPMELSAAWIALEDVSPGSGELEYYVGSHRIPEFHFAPGRRHYDPSQDTPVRHTDFERHLAAYTGALGCERRLLHVKKGDVLFWHADLVHGGSSIINKDLTRKSLVGHYCPISTQPNYFVYLCNQPAPHSFGCAYYASSKYR